MLTEELECVSLHDQHAHIVDQVADASAEIMEVEYRIEHAVCADIQEAFHRCYVYHVVSRTVSFESREPLESTICDSL
jgi:hypothetical protein